jgi:two-component system, LytTR family, response regulator
VNARHARVRIIVVDDEPLAREHLVALVAGEPDVQVIGEAGSGSDAVRLIRSMKPDAVFLDVQMPGLNGFDVLRAIPAEQLPLVVFVTAYDEYAVNAFEVSAIDYLLKPVLEDRLRLAVRRIVDGARAPKAQDALARLSALAELLPGATFDRISISVDGRVLFLSPREIDWVDAADDHVRVHAGKATHVVRETMASVESRLGPGFVRIHRSTLVNARRIREIQPWVKGDYVLILHDGTRLTSGRTYREHVRALLP